MASLVRRCVPVMRSICKHSKFVKTPIANISQQNKVQNASIGLFRKFSSTEPKLEKETVTIHFSLPDGKKHAVKAKVGDNLLDVIIENDVDIDGFGACEGTLACSTCHLIFKPEDYKKIEDTPTDEELDMLDLAYGLTDTSRLGCQVIATKEMDGLEVRVPTGVSDARDV